MPTIASVTAPAVRPLRLKRPRLPRPSSDCSSFASFAVRRSLQTDARPQTLAVLGGGLGGLATAHHYLRNLPPHLRPSATGQRTRIVVLEQQHRVGGWCQSVTVQNNRILSPSERPNDKEPALVFETGPRSIRPQGLLGWLTVDLAHEIGLGDKIITVPKSAPSAKNRYLYTPPNLTRLPSSLGGALKALFTTPLLRRIFPSLLLEPFRPRSPLHLDPHGLGDESVDSFFSRRFGPVLAADMISAMIHGIYAGDARRLSVRAVFPQLWEAEREHGSIVRAALFGGWARRRRQQRQGMDGPPASAFRVRADEDERAMKATKVRIAARHAEGGHRLVHEMERASVWGLRGGIEVLTNRLRENLEAQGVEFWMGERGKVERVEKANTGLNSWQISTASGDTLAADQLVTAVPQLLPADFAPPPIPSTTVAVINLAFPAPPAGSAPLFPPGFGYLIPRTVPRAQNPHEVLGVLFDSDVMPGVDDSAEQGLVKASVLLGGSYWLDRPSVPTPSHEELVDAALDTLRLHFPGNTFPAPTQALTHLHRDCIPQVPPGSLAAFRAFGARLRKEGQGRVAVVGGGFSAVGVNGCVRSAWEVGSAMALLRAAEVEEEVPGSAGGGGVRREASEQVARPVKTGTEMWEL